MDCAICKRACADGEVFRVADIHSAPQYSPLKLLWVSLVSKFPIETSAIGVFCENCFNRFVQPAAELDKLPDYRRRLIFMYFTNIPAMLFIVAVGAPLLFFGVATWATAFATFGATSAAVFLSHLHRPWATRRYFGAQISPLEMALGISGMRIIMRVRIIDPKVSENELSRA